MTRSRVIWFSLAALAVIAVVVVALDYRRVRQERTLALAGVPPRPDLQSSSEPLRRHVTETEEAIVSGRKPLESLGRLATVYHANGFYDQAQAAYRVLRDAKPRDPLWLHRAAHIHAQFGELPEAIALWRRVTELAPDYMPAQIGLGEALLKSNQGDAAATVFNAVLQRNSTNVYARFGLARLDVARKDWTAAQAKLEAIANETAGLLGADLLATVYERSGAPERGAALRARQKSHGLYVTIADPWSDQVMEACYDPYRLALESGTAALRKDTARAERLILRALELDPDDANLNFHAGSQAEQRGDLAGARTYLESAIRVDATLTDAWAALVRVQQKQGQTPLAFQTLTRGLAANPDSPVLLLERARYYKSQARTDAAMADFRRITRLRRDEALAFIELARLCFEQERIDEGIQVLEEGLQAEPGHPIALAILAFAGIHAGKQELADRCLREISDHPRVPAQERSRLLQAYRDKFGRAFSSSR